MLYLSRFTAIALVLAGCTCEDEPAAREETEQVAQPVREPGVAEQAGAEPDPGEPAPDLSVGGLTLRRLEDGRIELHGTDRWGGSLDTTYENDQYLTNALPTLERAITEEQAEAIRAFVR